MIGFRPMPQIFLTLVLMGALSAALITHAQACGRDTDCKIGDRSYRIALPEPGAAGAPKGAVVFVHGYRGTAARVMGNQSLTALASKLGVAFVAAQAAGPEWNIPNIPSDDALEGVDELAYFDALAEDLADRFAIERSRVVVAGFSSGAMMVWHLACFRGDSFAGFVPMSGTFWEPIPETCPTIPANLIHYHGTNDPVVPLQGHQIKDAHQGDVRQAVALFGGLGNYQPAGSSDADDLDCTRQTDPAGRILELCLFPGKHEFRSRHLARALKIIGISRSP